MGEVRKEWGREREARWKQTNMDAQFNMSKWCNTVDREFFIGKIFRLLNFRLTLFSSLWPLYNINLIHCKKIFRWFNFVVESDRQNFFPTKISPSTVMVTCNKSTTAVLSCHHQYKKEHQQYTCNGTMNNTIQYILDWLSKHSIIWTLDYLNTALAWLRMHSSHVVNWIRF